MDTSTTVESLNVPPSELVPVTTIPQSSNGSDVNTKIPSRVVKCSCHEIQHFESCFSTEHACYAKSFTMDGLFGKVVFPNICYVCHMVDATHCCSRCRLAVYCSVECQKAGYENHKDQCYMFQALYPLLWASLLEPLGLAGQVEQQDILVVPNKGTVLFEVRQPLIAPRLFNMKQARRICFDATQGTVWHTAALTDERSFKHVCLDPFARRVSFSFSNAFTDNQVAILDLFGISAQRGAVYMPKQDIRVFPDLSAWSKFNHHKTKKVDPKQHQIFKIEAATYFERYFTPPHIPKATDLERVFPGQKGDFVFAKPGDNVYAFVGCKVTTDSRYTEWPKQIVYFDFNDVTGVIRILATEGWFFCKPASKEMEKLAQNMTYNKLLGVSGKKRDIQWSKAHRQFWNMF